ncbi:zinc-ribbon domain-containing protein [Succinimonas sp.]|uniref:zinc-ribbon domain-containing protein n=1 Tax=Succinimonas sp. TaxID=1936151 RepID=UPI003866B15F
MKCSFCGNEVPDNARTCPRCGIYLSRTFRDQNRDTGSEEDRITPDSRADYRNPRNRREPPPGRDPREQRPEFSSDDAETAPDSRFGSSPDPRQTPHDFSEEPEDSYRRQPPPRRNFCSLCGNSLMPGDRFCSICGAPASGGNPGNYGNPGRDPYGNRRPGNSGNSGGSPAGDPYRNRRPGNSGNSGNRPGRRPVNDPQRLRALNQRMESMSRMVISLFVLALGGILLPFCWTAAAVVHIVIVFKSLPLAGEVVSILDSQGAEYQDWSAKGRGARAMIIALLLLIIALVPLTSVLMFLAVTNINVHGSIPESEKTPLIIASLIAGFLFITDIALQIFAMIRFYDIKRMLKNLVYFVK